MVTTYRYSYQHVPPNRAEGEQTERNNAPLENGGTNQQQHTSTQHMMQITINTTCTLVLGFLWPDSNVTNSSDSNLDADLSLYVSLVPLSICCPLSPSFFSTCNLPVASTADQWDTAPLPRPHVVDPQTTLDSILLLCWVAPPPISLPLSRACLLL